MSPWRRSVLLVPILAFSLALPSMATTERFRPGLPHENLAMELSDDFGRWLKGRMHMGIDIFSPRGTPVVSVADGVVTVMTYDDRPGWYLAIQHDDGWRSLYLHLDGAEPRWSRDARGAETAYASGLVVGDEVEAGEVVGFVGTSGNAGRHPPHTHFELRFLGEAIDPYPYVMAALTAARIESAIDRGDSPYR